MPRGHRSREHTGHRDYDRLVTDARENERGSRPLPNEPRVDVDTGALPPAIKYIVGYEVSESFSYYGIRAILALYLSEYMLFRDDDATMIIHSFIVCSSVFSLVGGWAADSFWGKYKTVMFMSLIYIMGGAMLSLSSSEDILSDPDHPPRWAAFVGLFLIAVGVGGINPCLSSFVGDQFKGGQEELLTSLYHLFYLSVNVGSIMSFFGIPMLRAKVNVSAAFAIPVAIFFVCTLIFFSGRRHYIMVQPKRNPYPVLWNVVTTARQERDEALRRGEVANIPLLDWAKPICGRDQVEAVRAVIDVLKVFTPLPVFWALYDQQTSRWVFQAREMNRLVGTYEFTPDQVNTLNPFLLLCLIPLFDHGIYPAFRKCGIDFAPLKRMATGMFFTACAFLMSGYVQQEIARADDEGLPRVHIAMMIPQYLMLGIGEVMLSITGLEFAYSQSPKAVKSVIMALWFGTSALGNLLVVAFAKQKFLRRSQEAFFYAGVMFVFLFIFIMIAWGYRYRPITAANAADPRTHVPHSVTAKARRDRKRKRKKLQRQRERERRRAMANQGYTEDRGETIDSDRSISG